MTIVVGRGSCFRDVEVCMYMRSYYLGIWQERDSFNILFRDSFNLLFRDSFNLFRNLVSVHAMDDATAFLGKSWTCTAPLLTTAQKPRHVKTSTQGPTSVSPVMPSPY